eukprot:6483131-Amphidinium_carterae.2
MPKSASKSTSTQGNGHSFSDACAARTWLPADVGRGAWEEEAPECVPCSCHPCHVDAALEPPQRSSVL